jgi:hypothetical protein
MRIATFVILTLLTAPSVSRGQLAADPSNPPYLQDRGTGVPTSMFGTYVRKKEVVVYPFFEYYRDRNFEYKPEELGAPGDIDFRGRYRASEALFFVGYGVTDNIAVEFETAVISASFNKSPADPSSLPATIKESGLGDAEGQIRWRWRRETERRPEWFSYGELVVPHARNKRLIGTPEIEVKFGTGVTRGFAWGTLTGRGAIEYSRASSSPWDVGEYAIEYLKRVSPKWRVYAGLEGTQDELSLITEAQWHVLPHGFVRLNNGLGLTSKATDWTPEIGLLLTFLMR